MKNLSFNGFSSNKTPVGQAISIERIKLLFAHANVVIAANILNSIIMAAVQWDAVDHPLIIAWVAFVWAITAARMAMVVKFRRADVDVSSAGKWKNLYMASAFISGAIWGSAALILMPVQLLSHKIFTVLVLGGMAIGAVVADSVVMGVFYAYVIPLLVPLAVKLVLEADETSLATGLLVGAYGILMTILAREMNNSANTSLLIRFENTILLEQVSSEKLKLDETNAALLTKIKEHENAEQALRESEERLERLNEAAFEGIVISRNGKFLDVNSFFTRMFGYSREELIGASALELTAPEYRGIVKNNMLSGYERPYEIMGLRKDGSVFPLEIRGKSIVIGGEEARITAIRDLTEGRAAEDAIRKSEETLRTVTSSVNDAIIMIDSAGIINFWNPAAERIFGYTSAEAVGQLISSLVIPERLREAHCEGLSNFAATGHGPIIGKTIQVAGMRKSGDEFPMELSISALWYRDKWWAAGVARDITERNLAKKALEESERRYRTVADHTFNWEEWRGPKGRLLYISPSCQRISGYSREEFLEDDSLEIRITHPDDREALEKHYRTIHGGVGYHELEFRITTKSGEERWILHCCQNVFDIDGEWLGRRASNMDITGRKRAEDRLLEAQSNLAEAQKIARIGSFNLDVLTNRLALSDEMRGIFNLGPERRECSMDCLYELLLNVSHPEDRDFVEVALDNAITKFAGSDINFRVIVGGRTRHIHMFVKIFRSRGKISGVAQDVTEIKLAEEALKRAKEEAEAATKLKDKFVSLVAHDLKSPMSSAMSLLRLMDGDGTAQMGAREKEIMGHVANSMERMIRTVDELLNISRLQTGKIKPEPRFFDTCELSGAVISKISQLAEKKGITVVNGIPSGLRLYTDSGLLEEVIQNLLTNAIKFSHAGQSVRLNAAQGGGRIIISVADDGTGVKKQLLPLLFRHEEKTSIPGTAGEVGTGFGLPLSHDIMSALGGELTVESEEGKGSVFHASLPDKQPVALVVEDEPATRRLLRAQLERIGVTVFEAASGREAVETLGKIGANLVLADIMMPEIDGLDLLKIIKTTPATAKIPVIIVTADLTATAKENAFRLGANGYVTKPFDEKSLLPIVKRYVA
ncbi:MAG: PAS domain S-box protein [Nitrospinae bacterium]|nr:PAS domain S-box protein [Nitrospinota bacterium]